MNNVVIVGRLTKDPELRYIPGSGTPVATFTLAIDRDYKNKEGNTPTDFIPCEIMGKPAEYVANYVQKGYLVAIQGSIRVDRYETPECEKRNFTKVFGNRINNLQTKKDGGQAQQTPPNSPAEFAAVDDDDVSF